MEDRAPVELALIEFPENEFKGEIISELTKLVDAGTITLIDALLIRKNQDGSTEWFEATDAEDARMAELVGEPSGLLAEEDVEAVAAEVEPGSSIGMLLFEHAWAARLAGAIRNANGQLLNWTRVPAEAIDELTAHLEKEG